MSDAGLRFVDAACAAYSAEPGKAPAYMRTPEQVRQFFLECWRNPSRRDVVIDWASRKPPRGVKEPEIPPQPVLIPMPIVKTLRHEWLVELQAFRLDQEIAIERAKLEVEQQRAIAVADVRALALAETALERGERPAPRTHRLLQLFHAQQRRAFARRARLKDWLRGFVFNYLCW